MEVPVAWVSPMALCFGCATRRAQFVCKPCQVARYCSAECQQSAWCGDEGHRHFCQPLKTLMTTTTPMSIQSAFLIGDKWTERMNDLKSYQQFLNKRAQALAPYEGLEANVGDPDVVLDRLWSVLREETRSAAAFASSKTVFSKAMRDTVIADQRRSAEYTDWSAAAQLWRLLPDKEHKHYSNSAKAGMKFAENLRHPTLVKQQQQHQGTKRAHKDVDGDEEREKKVKRQRLEAVQTFLQAPGMADLAHVNGLTRDALILLINQTSLRIGEPAPETATLDSVADQKLREMVWRVLFLADIYRGSGVGAVQTVYEAARDKKISWERAYASAGDTPSIQLPSLNDLPGDVRLNIFRQSDHSSRTSLVLAGRSTVVTPDLTPQDRFEAMLLLDEGRDRRFWVLNKKSMYVSIPGWLVDRALDGHEAPILAWLNTWENRMQVGPDMLSLFARTGLTRVLRNLLEPFAKNRLLKQLATTDDEISASLHEHRVPNAYLDARSAAIQISDQGILKSLLHDAMHWSGNVDLVRFLVEELGAPVEHHQNLLYTRLPRYDIQELQCQGTVLPVIDYLTGVLNNGRDIGQLAALGNEAEKGCIQYYIRLLFQMDDLEAAQAWCQRIGVTLQDILGDSLTIFVGGPQALAVVHRDPTLKDTLTRGDLVLYLKASSSWFQKKHRLDRPVRKQVGRLQYMVETGLLSDLEKMPAVGPYDDGFVDILRRFFEHQPLPIMRPIIEYLIDTRPAWCGWNNGLVPLILVSAVNRNMGDYQGMDQVMALIDRVGRNESTSDNDTKKWRKELIQAMYWSLSENQLGPRIVARIVARIFKTIPPDVLFEGIESPLEELHKDVEIEWRYSGPAPTQSVYSECPPMVLAALRYLERHNPQLLNSNLGLVSEAAWIAVRFGNMELLQACANHMGPNPQATFALARQPKKSPLICKFNRACCDLAVQMGWPVMEGPPTERPWKQLRWSYNSLSAEYAGGSELVMCHDDIDAALSYITTTLIPRLSILQQLTPDDAFTLLQRFASTNSSTAMSRLLQAVEQREGKPLASFIRQYRNLNDPITIAHVFDFSWIVSPKALGLRWRASEAKETLKDQHCVTVYNLLQGYLGGNAAGVDLVVLDRDEPLLLQMILRSILLSDQTLGYIKKTIVETVLNAMAQANLQKPRGWWSKCLKAANSAQHKEPMQVVSMFASIDPAFKALYLRLGGYLKN